MTGKVGSTHWKELMEKVGAGMGVALASLHPRSLLIIQVVMSIMQLEVLLLTELRATD